MASHILYRVATSLSLSSGSETDESKHGGEKAAGDNPLSDEETPLDHVDIDIGMTMTNTTQSSSSKTVLLDTPSLVAVADGNHLRHRVGKHLVKTHNDEDDDGGHGDDKGMAPHTTSATIEVALDVTGDKRALHRAKVDAYMEKRTMTPLQERWNAITMLPGGLYCIYFVLAQPWLSLQTLDADRILRTNDSEDSSSWVQALLLMFGMYSSSAEACDVASSNPLLQAPLSVLSIAFGILIHLPFSFMYHWKYATSLPTGRSRIEHWSRRMDHSMIHLCSAFVAYGTSGNPIYFAVNLMLNAACIYLQFLPDVRASRNTSCVLLAMCLYTMPVLIRGQVEVFVLWWSLLAVGCTLFAAYPLGGWSHSAFHLVIALTIPVAMQTSLDLPTSQSHVTWIAECMAQQPHS